MQSHSAKTPSVCKLRPLSNAPPFLSGPNLQAWHGASGARRKHRPLPVGTDSAQDAPLKRASAFNSEKQEQSLPTTQRKENVKLFLKAVFLNSLLAQGVTKLLTGHAVL